MKNFKKSLCVFVATVTLSVAAYAGRFHYDGNYTIGQILKSPEATKVLEKYLPGFTKSDQLEMAKGMTINQIAEYPQSGISGEKLAKLVTELSQVETDEPAAD